jgi:cell division protein FtsB
MINSFLNIDDNSRYFTSVNDEGKITLEMSLNGEWALFRCFSREELYNLLFHDKPEGAQLLGEKVKEISKLEQENAKLEKENKKLKEPKGINTDNSIISTLTSQLMKCESDKAYWQSQHSQVSNLAKQYEEDIAKLKNENKKLENKILICKATNLKLEANSGEIQRWHDAYYAMNVENNLNVQKIGQLENEIQKLKQQVSLQKSDIEQAEVRIKLYEKPKVTESLPVLKIHVGQPWQEYPFIHYFCTNESHAMPPFLYPDGTWNLTCNDKGRFKSINELWAALEKSPINSSSLDRAYPLIRVRFGQWNHFGRKGWYCIDKCNLDKYLDIFGNWTKYEVAAGDNWLFESKEQILEKLKAHRWTEKNK